MAEETKVFDWDDEIENDGEERDFVTLEEGDYEFSVVKFERSHYTPKKADGKTPSCNQADITLMIHTESGDAFIVDRFPLASTMEWKISAFFRSIGLKKHGERLKMQWKESIGLTGKAHITKTQGKNDGVYFNNVSRYLDPVEGEEDEWS